MPRVRRPSPAPTPPPVPETGQGAFGSVLGTAATAPQGPHGEQVSTFRLSAWTLVRYTLVIVLVLGGLYLLWRIQEVLLLLLLAILVATAIEPLVNRLRRGPFSRGQGIIIVYTVIVLAIGIPAYILVPSVA